MKYTLGAFVAVTIFTLLVDFLLYRLILNHKNERPRLFNFPFGAFWHYSLTVIFIIAFGVLYALVPIAESSTVYVIFQWILTIYLFIYSSKVFYYLGYKLSHRARKVKAKLTDTGQIKKMNDGRYPRISRKKFLSQIGIITASLPFVSLLFGVMKGRFAFSKRYTKLSFPNLPASFDGLKIVQISDLHLGSLNSNYQEMEEAVELINAEHPDIICFTGDLVNNFYEETIGWEKVFKKLKARHGKYSIMGNHDYGDYSKWPSTEAKAKNLAGIKGAHQRLGFKLLNNASLPININGEKIAMAGVENWGHPPFPQYGNLSEASKGIEELPFKILMSHDPDHWDAEVIGKTNYDLTLAGHTHGMQFGIDFKGFQWSPAKYKFKRWSGLYKSANQFLYVNRGLGYLGMPARVGMPPEITILELTKGPISNDPM